MEMVKAMVASISIHAPREGGDLFVFHPGGGVNISIHAPREGGDTTFGYKFIKNNRFQSTPPARGATFYQLFRCVILACISIHAPREGGDVPVIHAAYPSHQFQSTPPARGATIGRGRGLPHP